MRIRRGGVTYNITTTVTNGTYSGDTTITDTATVIITADSGYTLPDTVTVTGASQTWNKETGTLTLSNPTGAVTVSAVCVEAVTGETWVLNETLNTTVITGDKGAPFTSNGSQYLYFNRTYDTEDAYDRLDYQFGGWGKTTIVYYGPIETGQKWLNQAYRTITFAQPVTNTTLLAWLQANGTKQ